jgi:hypothetical protein
MLFSFFARSNRKSSGPRRRASFRPQLESLEDRTVLSPLLTGGVQENVVNDTPATSGGVSLGGAVQVASTLLQGGVGTTATNPYGYTNTNFGTVNQSSAWIVLVGQPLGNQGQNFTLNTTSAAGVSPGEFQVEIDWGNGTSKGQAIQSGSEILFQSPSHVWNQAGTYDVTVHVQDTRWGNQWEYKDTVYVQPLSVTPSTPPAPTKPPAPPPAPPNPVLQAAGNALATGLNTVDTAVGNAIPGLQTINGGVQAVANTAKNIAYQTGIAQTAEVINTVDNAVGTAKAIYNAGKVVIQNGPKILQAAKNVGQTAQQLLKGGAAEETAATAGQAVNKTVGTGQPPATPSQTPANPGSSNLNGRATVAQNVQDAKNGGLMQVTQDGPTTEIAPNKVDAAVQTHSNAPTVRQNYGVPGKGNGAYQSAHLFPQSFGQFIPGYSPGKALTTLLPANVHAAFDKQWMDWVRTMRSEGQTSTTAGELYKALDSALHNTPNLSPATQGALSSQLFEEMFNPKGLGLQWSQQLTLPKIN